jgi:hypothetical protein
MNSKQITLFIHVIFAIFFFLSNCNNEKITKKNVPTNKTLCKKHCVTAVTKSKVTNVKILQKQKKSTDFINDLVKSELLLLQNKQQICQQQFNCDSSSAWSNGKPICSNNNRTFQNKCKFFYFNCLFNDDESKSNGLRIECETKCPCS